MTGSGGSAVSAASALSSGWAFLQVLYSAPVASKPISLGNVQMFPNSLGQMLGFLGKSVRFLLDFIYIINSNMHKFLLLFIFEIGMLLTINDIL